MEKARIGRLRAPVLLALILAACATTAVNVRFASFWGNKEHQPWTHLFV